MDSNFGGFYEKLVIIGVCIFAGIFSIAIGVATQYIQIRDLPRSLVIKSIIIQFILSIGVFIGVCLFFNSSFLPGGISNDLWTMLVSAYFLASAPQVAITIFLIIANKEINNFLTKRYGSNKDGAPNLSFNTIQSQTNDVKKDEPDSERKSENTGAESEKGAKG